MKTSRDMDVTDQALTRSVYVYENLVCLFNSLAACDNLCIQIGSRPGLTKFRTRPRGYKAIVMLNST